MQNLILQILRGEEDFADLPTIIRSVKLFSC